MALALPVKGSWLVRSFPEPRYASALPVANGQKVVRAVASPSTAAWAWPTLLVLGLNLGRLKRMFRPPGVQRLLWSSWLWVPLSLVTVFDTSGNAVGYPVFFAFVLTYTRDRNGVIAGDWKEAFATFALVVAALCVGVWVGDIPSYFLPIRRSWHLVVKLQRFKCLSICIWLWLLTLFFRVYRLVD